MAKWDPAEEILPNDEANGVKCPGCNCGHSYVIKTKRVLNLIRRRRECRHCGRRFTTTEKINSS